MILSHQDHIGEGEYVPLPAMAECGLWCQSRIGRSCDCPALLLLLALEQPDASQAAEEETEL